jgi:integrase
MPKINSAKIEDNTHVKTLLDFGVTGYFRDDRTRYLLLRLGKKRDIASWYFAAEHQRNGERIITHRLLGHFPKMDVFAARSKAEELAGDVARKGPPSQIRFSVAWDDYMRHQVEPRAAKKSNPKSWAHAARSYAKNYILPKWSKWTLVDMSANPAIVRDWHAEISKTAPATANHCAALVRACYKHMRKLERGLPPDLPTSAVRWNEASARQIAIIDWRGWAIAWRSIPDAERRSFHMLCLLTSMRPGELARLAWRHVDCKRRTITIPAAKAGPAIVSPMSWPIASALRMARDAVESETLVFPNVARRRSDDGLPVAGMGLRHTWSTVAAELETDELWRHVLMGHKLAGVSRGYIAKSVLQNSAALRRAQARISREMMRRLGL